MFVLGVKIPKPGDITICCTRTQLRAASLWFAAQTLPQLALLRWAGKQGVKKEKEKG